MFNFQIIEAMDLDAKYILEFTKIVGLETKNLSFGAECLPISIEEYQKFLSNYQKTKRGVFSLAKKGFVIEGK
jgi:hypothetical protein